MGERRVYPMPRRNLSKITATTATALVFAVVLSSVVLAADTPKERTPQPRPAAAMPFVPSEELVYEGEFTKMLLRGVDIAELRFKAQRVAGGVAVEGEGQEGVTAPLVLTTDVTSKGFFPKLFGMSFKFHAETQVEPNDFYALRSVKKDEQGKRIRTSETVFDQ